MLIVKKPRIVPATRGFGYFGESFHNLLYENAVRSPPMQFLVGDSEVLDNTNVKPEKLLLFDVVSAALKSKVFQDLGILRY
jgi:hypothetical protein